MTDRSGARRFWIFEAQIDRPKLNAINFRQLWAQAVVDARELIGLDLIPISQNFVDWTIDRGKNNTPTDNSEVLFEEFLEENDEILSSEIQEFCNENNIRLSTNVKSELLHKHLFVCVRKRIEFTQNQKRVWVKNAVTVTSNMTGT
ncbi:hypothetical protein FACS1894170_02820 [Planctomycetales bacterium]|nr:hypothetical protein FACS1894170_02820 [Planctomycetales bacterium]